MMVSFVSAKPVVPNRVIVSYPKRYSAGRLARLLSEEDLSRTLYGDKDRHPCLSWFPIDTLSGAKDINFQHKEAGFQAQSNGTYCYKANLFARPFVGSSCGANGCTCPSNYSLVPTDSKFCQADFSIPYQNIPKNGVFGLAAIMPSRQNTKFLVNSRP